MTKKLTVSIDITPHAQNISSAEMDALFEGELRRFEEFFLSTQAKTGAASPLITGERGIGKAYLYYAYTKKQDTETPETP